MRLYCPICSVSFDANLPVCPNDMSHGVRRIFKAKRRLNKNSTRTTITAFEVFDSTLCDYHDPFGKLKPPSGLKRKRPEGLREDDERPEKFAEIEIKPSGKAPHTYTRSARSKHHGTPFKPFSLLDPGLGKKDGKLVRQSVILANVGGFTNYLEAFNTMTTGCRVDERKRWHGSGLLYERLRRYYWKQCEELVSMVNLECVYAFNEYTCVHIDLTNHMNDLFEKGKEAEKEAFVEYMCFTMNAYIDFESQKIGYRMPCVCRSSFGFLTPTTAPTVSSIRLNLGIAPLHFLGCVEEAIKAFLGHLDELVKMARKKKPTSSFFTGEDYSGYRKDKVREAQKKKKKDKMTEEEINDLEFYDEDSTLRHYLNEKICSMKGLMANVTRKFGGGSFATEVCYDALRNQKNGIITAIEATLGDNLWEIRNSTLSYALTNKELYTYSSKSLTLMQESWTNDLAFKKMVEAIFNAAGMEVGGEEPTLDGAWAAAIFAAEQIYREGIAVYHKQEGAKVFSSTEDGDYEDGSDSELEDESDIEEENRSKTKKQVAPETKIYHLKLISLGGMNAIDLSLVFSKLWIEKQKGKKIEVLDVVPMTFDQSLLGNAKINKKTENYGGKRGLTFVEIEPNDTSVDITVKSVTVRPYLLFKPPRQKLPDKLPVKTVKIYMQEMYFETPHLLDVNRWLTPVKKMDHAKIILGDYNHCVTSLSVKRSFDISKNVTWKTKSALIVDVTSATLEGMSLLVEKFRRDMPATLILILVSSGLKNEQGGTDKNAYGTVRFFVKRSKKTQLRECYDALKEHTAYKRQSIVSHSVRRSFKVAGLVPTIEAILLPPKID